MRILREGNRVGKFFTVTFSLGLFLSFILGTMAGCNFRNVKQSGESSNLPLDKLEFKTLKNGLLGPKCLRCHDGSVANAPNLSDYQRLLAFVVPGQPEQSPFYLALLPGERQMPPGEPLSIDEINYVREWILRGAPEDLSVSPTTTLTPKPQSWFENIQTNVLKPQCIRCHGAEILDHQWLLDEGWIFPNQPAFSRLYQMISEGEMPPEEENDPVNPVDIDSIRRWIEAGANKEGVAP